MKTRCSQIVLVLATIGCAAKDEVSDTAATDDSLRHTDIDTDDSDVEIAKSECAPLPDAPPNAIVVTPGDAPELRSIIDAAPAGGTVLFESGTYAMDGAHLWITTEGLTLRGATGNRDDVVLDGGYQSTQMITVRASNVTIADMTLRRPYTHAVHVSGVPDGETGDVDNVWLHNLHIQDPGQQAVKINASAGSYADDGTMSCSHLEMTSAGRSKVRDNCYTGGFDAHYAQSWTVRDNLIEGFWCETGLSEHGIHFWNQGRDQRIERNEIRNCARGIGLGLAEMGGERDYGEDLCPNAVGYVGNYGGLIENNTVWAADEGLFDSEYGFDSGIALTQSCASVVRWNTVWSSQAPYSSIEWRYANTSALIDGNLVSHDLRSREGGQASLAHNIADAPAAWFADAARGDLHLVEGADPIDAGGDLAPGSSWLDFDGDRRVVVADVGADEWTAKPAAK